MEQPAITFIINGKTYNLRATDAAAIAAIHPAERQQLITLLEAVRQQEERARAVVQGSVDQARMASSGATGIGDTTRAAGSGDYAIVSDRLGSGDVDALMARLAMEESRGRKPGPTRQGLYRWVLGVAVAIILLVIIL